MFGNFFIKVADVFLNIFDFFKNYGWYDRFVLTAQSVSTGGKEQSFLGK